MLNSMLQPKPFYESVIQVCMLRMRTPPGQKLQHGDVSLTILQKHQGDAKTT